MQTAMKRALSLQGYNWASAADIQARPGYFQPLRNSQVRVLDLDGLVSAWFLDFISGLHLILLS